MKKVYYRPQIRIVEPMGELLFDTDSNGLKSVFKSREGSASFEDDDEEEITKSVWFDD